MAPYLIIILAILLRLNNIDKPEGLWNDEYVSWFVASTPFIKGFWTEVLKQCHMPLYYLYLKPFSICPDIVLRILSVIPSLLAIPVMYLIGKFYSKTCAKFCATTTAILPFLIYYSQEVRFYSLLFFFSTLSLYFLLKIIIEKKGIWGYTISSLLILFTHILGSIYVLPTTFYLIYKKNRFSKWFLLGSLAFFILLYPFAKILLTMIPHSQWWGNFSYTNILFLFSDFFSPILTNNINAPTTFFYSQNLCMNILLTIPTIFAGIGIALGFKQFKGLTLIALSVTITMGILAQCGIIVFITKYLIEILPIFILIFSFGLSQTKIRNIIFYMFMFINILAAFTPFYPTKIPRVEGHKLVADALLKQNSDKIIFTYYDENRFSRYLPKEYTTYHISKINRFEYLENPSRILDNIKKNEIFSVVFLDSVSFIPENFIEQAKQNNLPEMFVTFSIIKNELTNAIKKTCNDISIEKTGSWSVISAKKFK